MLQIFIIKHVKQEKIMGLWYMNIIWY